MDTASLVPQGTTLVILGIVLISGPLVPGIDLTVAPDLAESGAGASSAEVSIVKPPEDGFRIAPGRTGAGPYLYSPPVTVHVTSVRGSPVLIYEIKINQLQFLTAQMVLLTDRIEGEEVTIAIDRYSLQRDEHSESSYDAEVSLRLRAGNHTQNIYENTFSVPVESDAAG